MNSLRRVNSDVRRRRQQSKPDGLVGPRSRRSAINVLFECEDFRLAITIVHESLNSEALCGGSSAISSEVDRLRLEGFRWTSLGQQGGGFTFRAIRFLGGKRFADFLLHVGLNDTCDPTVLA